VGLAKLCLIFRSPKHYNNSIEKVL